MILTDYYIMLVGWVGLMINDGDHDEAFDEVENNADGNDDLSE